MPPPKLKPEKGAAAGFDAGSALDDVGAKLNSGFWPPGAAADVAGVFCANKLLVVGGFVEACLLVKEKGAGAGADAGVVEAASLFD